MATIQDLTKEPSCKIFHSAATTLCGLRAHEVVYTGTHNHTSLIFKQVWVIVHRKAYIVTLTCDAVKYQTLLPFAQLDLTHFGC